MESVARPAPRLGGVLPAEVRQVFERSFVCEYTSLTRAGRPVTWPVTPYAGRDGTLDVTTGLSYPDKAERARRDPRVALLYSDPAGSGLDRPPVVLVQGRAAVRDADLRPTPTGTSARRWPRPGAGSPTRRCSCSGG
ncbi:pyridoxamine 5'-phosphate oxidase family protein [Nonomuraea sp. NPDC050451]|uniref:pyridoxamine 5'-phosphate oxidase family protein n=1 Tax=Nonomuraea sp. NPDC050451 TaxID=3364364 RepID=UPI0037AFFEF4